MKLTVLLLLGLCAFQTFESHSIDEVKNIEDITDDIKKLINNLNQLSTDISQTLQNVGNSLTTVYNDMQTDILVVGDNFSKLIKDTTDVVEQIAETGDKGRECVREHSKEVDNWESHVGDNLTICGDDAFSGLHNISSAYILWEKDVNDFVTNIGLTIKACTNFPEQEEILACLQKAYSKASDDYNGLNQTADELNETIDTTGNLILKVFLDCGNTAYDDSANKANDIIKEINDCVAH